ncbi:site-specific integrase [Tissierella sp. MB52-C2]|uniref:tyrosine-type recombinase/integrase n=1 Tax=Tissierella sp. MB52-C2 TaxID=3070999 RepID=UPI00280BA880|nr:site-specific integrase [Tissierella sp. MB52-C2]WMM24093.1 site-specific integrase [Tissierella sp. MB52-C2]
MPAYKDEDRGTWYCKFYYTDWKGEYKQKKKRGFKLKRHAEDWEREFLLKNAGSPNMTFKTLVDLYYDDSDLRIRNSTIKTKMSIIDTHILPVFKSKIISEITKGDIRRWQNLMLKKKNPRNGEPYKPTYLRSINSQLSAILNYAVEYYNLPQNPCSRVKSIGKKRADEMKFWTLDEFNEVIVHEESPAYRIAFMTLFWTGIRSGELLALTPKKILDDIESLDICETYKREDGEDVFDETKNENPRIVSMPDFLYKKFKQYMNSLYGLEANDRIFYFTRTALNKELDRLIEKANIERIRVHDLRHSHVALLIELGYRTHAIAKRIGDTPEEVDRTYAHLYPNKDQDISKELSRHKDGIIGKAKFDEQDSEVYNDKEIAESLKAERVFHDLKAV